MLAPSLYLMDTNFWTSLGNYSLDARCEIANELGYSAVYETLSTGFPDSLLHDLNTIPPRYHIPLSAVYYTADLHRFDTALAESRKVIEQLTTTDTLELAIHASAGIPARPDTALESSLHHLLDHLLPLALQHRKTISLYPHIWFYIDRIEHALRIAREYNSPHLKVTFCGFHWYAVDATQLSSHLRDAAPLLHRVNICGTRKLPPGTQGLPATIECLSQGELDHFALLSLLHANNYTGPIGLQGYSAAGDVYPRLQRSLAAYHSLRDRVHQHPHWAAHVLT